MLAFHDGLIISFTYTFSIAVMYTKVRKRIGGLSAADETSCRRSHASSYIFDIVFFAGAIILKLILG